MSGKFSHSSPDHLKLCKISETNSQQHVKNPNIRRVLFDYHVHSSWCLHESVILGLNLYLLMSIRCRFFYRLYPKSVLSEVWVWEDGACLKKKCPLDVGFLTRKFESDSIISIQCIEYFADETLSCCVNSFKDFVLTIGVGHWDTRYKHVACFMEKSAFQ